MTYTEIIQIIMGCLGSLGFSVLFNIRGKRLITATLGGLFAWFLFVVFSYFVKNEPLNYFLVSTIMTIYAELMARVLKTPTTAFITASLIPLIPGGSLYYTMAYAFKSDSINFVIKGTYTIQLASALALGIIVATTIFRMTAQKNKPV